MQSDHSHPAPLTPCDTRASLLRRLHDHGDSTAWVEFCEIYERAIHRVALRHGLQDADAREVSQEVLLTVSRRIHDFESRGPGRFRCWLAKLARNATIDQLRKNRRTSTIGWNAQGDDDTSGRVLPEWNSAMGAGDASDEFDVEARREQFRWAAAQVQSVTRPVTWQAFYLTAVRGESSESVAKRLGMTIGAVYVARCRVLAKIKSLVEPFREEPS